MSRKEKKRKRLNDRESVDRFFPTTHDKTWIYFVTVYANKGKYGKAVKIGLTKDIKRRMAGLQVGCPFQISLWYSFEVDSISAERLEHELHMMFKQAHMQGEWFAMNRNIVRWVNWHKEAVRLKAQRDKPRVINRSREERENYDTRADPGWMNSERTWAGLQFS